LHQAYGSYADLKAFIEAAHGLGIAVVLDVVYNHFGPEGNYSGAFAPYTKRAPTPWGEAVNFDGEFSYGVREYFLENTRYWLQDIGFDGFRMDAVSLIFDNSPVHIVREITDLARSIARAENREILMLAEHLRNNRYVTSEQGFNFHAQWNDDLNHAVFAHLTGETVRHYANFGSFDDVVKALQQGFVLDGSRFDQVHRVLLGTDGRLTHPEQHVVHIQNHDQVGNRAQGDRMMTTYGEARALLCITAVMASPFVPMLFMGEEYGETAPFLFFEDFSDPALVAAVQAGRNADFSFAGASPHAPHDRATWEACKLQWALRDSPQGQRVLAYYQQLIAIKRSGALGPHSFDAMEVRADASRKVVWIETRQTLTVLNFSNLSQLAIVPASWRLTLASVNGDAGIDSAHLPPYGAWIFRST
jgi:maltooligosyltrehalose trehalohydrolase